MTQAVDRWDIGWFSIDPKIREEGDQAILIAWLRDAQQEYVPDPD